MRAVVLHPDEDGYWVVECPSLPPCVSQGETKADAIANIKEVIEGWLETAKAHGQPIADEDFETHAVYVRVSDKRRIVVPVHKGRDLKPGTPRGLIDDMGLSVHEFAARV